MPKLLKGRTIRIRGTSDGRYESILNSELDELEQVAVVREQIARSGYISSEAMSARREIRQTKSH